MSEEFINGIDEYKKVFGIKRHKKRKANTVLAKRICPFCGHQDRYSNQRIKCSECGVKFKDFVIRNRDGYIIS